MAYRTTPQASTGESPFYLLYGRDATVPSSLDFYRPKPPAVTLESEYGRELFKELKQVRALARQSITRAQVSQKYQYDKEVKESKIGCGNQVMLKADPKFKLDHQFRRPYRVQNVTATCAYIQPINQAGSEVICVSLQRVSRCRGSGLDTAKPWLGHCKTRKRRQLRPRIRPTGDDHNGDDAARIEQVSESAESNCNPKTRAGRTVRRPKRYLENNSFPDRSSLVSSREKVELEICHVVLFSGR